MCLHLVQPRERALGHGPAAGLGGGSHGDVGGQRVGGEREREQGRAAPQGVGAAAQAQTAELRPRVLLGPWEEKESKKRIKDV